MTNEDFYNYLNSANNTLEHHGIKGMKWGVRRTSEQLGKLKKLSNKEVTEKYREQLAVKNGKYVTDILSKKWYKDMYHETQGDTNKIRDDIDLEDPSHSLGSRTADLYLKQNPKANLKVGDLVVMKSIERAKTDFIKQEQNSPYSAAGGYNSIQEALKSGKVDSKTAKKMLDEWAEAVENEWIAYSKNLKPSKELGSYGEKYKDYLEMQEELDDTLEHHGIKGMKWGVRRTPEQLGNTSKESPKKTKQQVTAESIAREKSHTATYENRVNMTDEELKRAINRINLENQLKEASTKAAKLTDTRSEGQKLVDSMKNDIKKDLQAAAKDTATAYIKNKLDELVTGGKSTKTKPSDLINERERKAEEAKKQAEESNKRQAEAQKQAAKMQAEREAKEERAKAEKQAKAEKRAAEKMMEEAMVQGTKQIISKYAEEKMGKVVGSYDPNTGRFDWE